MTKINLLLLPGDGIGPEIISASQMVLEACERKYELNLNVKEAHVGGAGIDHCQNPFPKETQEAINQSDAVLLGAVGGPKWTDPQCRPEQGLLDMRKHMGVYANLRPVKPYPQLRSASPLKAEILEGVDILVVRELTSGIYFGEKTRSQDSASDLCTYHRNDIEKIVRKGFQFAQKRRGKLTMVDKANVLETSRLWREITTEIHQQEYASLELEILLVDAAAMHLLSRPADFDVLLTENMFGDILTDEASMLAGSLGVLPSASLGDQQNGLYEPIHGSAPDIAGQNRANPIGTILSLAMLFRHSLQMETIAQNIEQAVESAIDAGRVTADINQNQSLGTQETGQAIADFI